MNQELRSHPRPEMMAEANGGVWSRVWRERAAIASGVDLSIVFGALAVVSLVPVFFMVPHNDEWLRMNYLAAHSVWEWTMVHAETWVVRPTAEVILGFASLPNTRPALEHDFTVETFLGRFHAIYVVLIVAYWAMLYANAAIIAKSLRALPHATLMFFALLVCWLVSDELGFAFYWADGYANIMMPFTMFTCGLPLLFRTDLRANIAGAVLALLGGMGHEVVSIFGVGALGLALVLRRPLEHAWRQRAVQGVLLAVSLALVWWQLFGEGPMIRNDHYAANVGKRYDLPNAWLNIQQISPLRAFAATLAPIVAIAIYRDRLQRTIDAAVADFRRQRWFWILLALGALVTAFLPLGSVGLKKGRLAVSYYSVFTYLWFILFGVLLYPMLDRFVARWLRGYRVRFATLLPALLLVVACSKNIAEFQTAATNFGQLRLEAQTYMQMLFAAQATPERKLRLCRPRHPYSKPGRMMTDRNEEEYFRIKSVYNRCRGNIGL